MNLGTIRLKSLWEPYQTPKNCKGRPVWYRRVIVNDCEYKDELLKSKICPGWHSDSSQHLRIKSFSLPRHCCIRPLELSKILPEPYPGPTLRPPSLRLTTTTAINPVSSSVPSYAGAVLVVAKGRVGVRLVQIAANEYFSNLVRADYPQRNNHDFSPSAFPLLHHPHSQSIAYVESNRPDGGCTESIASG